jgi:hypothetical protein
MQAIFRLTTALSRRFVKHRLRPTVTGSCRGRHKLASTQISRRSRVVAQRCHNVMVSRIILRRSTTLLHDRIVTCLPIPPLLTIWVTYPYSASRYIAAELLQYSLFLCCLPDCGCGINHRSCEVAETIVFITMGLAHCSHSTWQPLLFNRYNKSNAAGHTASLAAPRDCTPQ